MSFADRLYSQSERDRVTIQIEPFRFATGLSIAATQSMYAAVNITADRALVLQQATWTALPGVAGSVHAFFLYEGGFVNSTSQVTDPKKIWGSSQPRVDSIAGFPTNQGYEYTQEFDDLLIPGSRAICLAVQFSAAIANNMFAGSLVGYTIPRGNIAL